MDASPNHSHARVVMEHAYAALIRDARRKPFQWGAHDCVLFAASAVRVRTGRDPLVELAISPTWTSAQEAQTAIDEVGGFRAALTRLYGEPVSILQARPGDLALANDPDHGGRELMTVAHGGGLLAPASTGLALLSLRSAVAAWRVG